MTELVFADWVTRRRKQLGLTQAALASHCLCATITIRRIEAGRLRPSPKMAGRLARALQVPVAGLPAFVTFARETGQRAAPESFGRPIDPAHVWELPAPLTALIGREREVTAGARMLRGRAQLLTLSGPPGVGKTRLSLALAEVLRSEFSAVTFVPLASVTDPAYVGDAIRDALELVPDRSPAPRPVLNELRDHLRTRSHLLVLDNFEQIVAAAPMIAALLKSCAGLKVIVSSRERLGLEGERELPVPALDVADIRRLPPPEALIAYSAIQLFVDRAQAVMPAFDLTADNAAPVAHICAELDGLPLAIEMAAVRVRDLNVGQIADQLRVKLASLAVEMRDLSPRQQSLRGALNWSYDLLADEERYLLRHLGVLTAPFTAALVAAVTALSLAEAERKLGSLVRKSLVIDLGQGQYDLLVIIRDYALEALVSAGEAPTAYRRLSDMLSLTLQGLIRQYQVQPVFAALARPLVPHVRTVLKLLVLEATVTAARLALSIGGKVWFYFRWRGLYAEGIDWLEQIVAHGARLNLGRDDDMGTCLRGLGILRWQSGDVTGALQALEQAVTQRRIRSDPGRMVSVLGAYGAVLAEAGRHAQALDVLDEGLRFAETSADDDDRAYLLGYRGEALHQGGRWEEAISTLRESLALNSRLRQPFRLTSSWYDLGLALRGAGRLEEARQAFAHGLAIALEIGELPYVLRNLIGQLETGAPPDSAAPVIEWLTAHDGRWREHLPQLVEKLERVLGEWKIGGPGDQTL